MLVRTMFLKRTGPLSLLLAICIMGRCVSAQQMFELRGADSKYRFVDWNYTFHNMAVADLFYIGVPGSNEFNLGGGYGIKIGNIMPKR
jgi:hypothetical protein